MDKSTAISPQRAFQLLTSKEAAKLLAITPQQLHDLATHGDITYVNVGLGDKRETRRYRLDDIERFFKSRTRIGTVKRSTHSPIEITDADLLAAAKIVARDRRRRERERARAILEDKWRRQREERQAWLKACDDEATAIRQRLFLESIRTRAR